MKYRIEEYRQMIKENDMYYIATKNKKTGWCGMASFIPSDKTLIRVYEGNSDGSDDKTITIEEFEKNYEYKLEVE